MLMVFCLKVRSLVYSIPRPKEKDPSPVLLPFFYLHPFSLLKVHFGMHMLDMLFIWEISSRVWSASGQSRSMSQLPRREGRRRQKMSELTYAHLPRHNMIPCPSAPKR